MSACIQKDIISTLLEAILSWIMKSISVASYAKGQKSSTEYKAFINVQMHVNHPLYSNLNSDLWRTNWKFYLIHYRCTMGQPFNCLIAVLWHLCVQTLCLQLGTRGATIAGQVNGGRQYTKVPARALSLFLNTKICVLKSVCHFYSI